jgi:type VI secretion system protein ImpA
MKFFNASKDREKPQAAIPLPYVVEIERLLVDISADAPSGEIDLSGDPAFIDLGIKIQGTPEREFGGKIVQDARPPEWPKIRGAAFNLLTRSHDLRAALFLMRAMLHTHGLTGLYTGLELLNGMIEDYWDTLYPQLDPADNNDPTERINILWELNEGPEIIDPLKNACLFSPQPTIGISLRDIHIASGKIAVKDADRRSMLSLAMIEEAFKECDGKALESTRQAIHQSIDSLERLEKRVVERVGTNQAPDYKDLTSILDEMAAFFDKHFPERTPLPPSKRPRKQQAGHLDATEPAGAAPPPPTPTGRPMETISSRQDVIHVLDLICAYYDQHEPASPVPLLLKRARQLVEKNFVEIVQDLVPQAADQIKSLFGDYPDDGS